MATNRVIVTLQIRNDEARDWLATNPVLAQGEYGLESDTFLGVEYVVPLSVDTEYFMY